jgi:hypothetical protein
MLRFAVPLLSLSLTGCLTHVAAREDSGSLRIGWQESYDAGRRAAAETQRPMLVVLVAGALQEHC